MPGIISNTVLVAPDKQSGAITIVVDASTTLVLTIANGQGNSVDVSATKNGAVYASRNIKPAQQATIEAWLQDQVLVGSNNALQMHFHVVTLSPLDYRLAFTEPNCPLWADWFVDGNRRNSPIKG